MPNLLAIASETFDTIPTDPAYQGIQSILPSQIVSAIVNLILGSAGVVSFIFLLWGGVQWIMAGGDKEALDKSRKKISNALIGLAVVFSSYALMFIVQALFGIQIIQLPLNPIASGAGAGPGGTASAATHCSSNPAWPIGFCGAGPCGGAGCWCTAPGSGCNSSAYAQFCPGAACP